jgi:hypothetical protein
MGAISSVTGYLIYYYALVRIPASRMAAFQYLQPVFASLMAVAMLGEQLTGAALAAGGVIFAGVFMYGAVRMSAFTRLLRTNRNYRFTWSGQVVSEVGDHFNNIAVMSLAMDHSNPGLVVTGVFLARAVPMLIRRADCGRVARPAEPQARDDRKRFGARVRGHRFHPLPFV